MKKKAAVPATRQEPKEARSKPRLEYADEWSDEFTGVASDRACGILGVVHLDEQLRDILSSYFVDRPSFVRELFERGVIQHFSQRTALAFALGFLTDCEVADLRILNQVRNDFAHKPHGLTFNNEGIKKRCADLKTWRGVVEKPDQPGVSARDQFIITVFEMSSDLLSRFKRLRRARLSVPSDDEVRGAAWLRAQKR